MTKQGPVPAFAHGLYEYLGGALLVALPLLVGYDHGAATAVSIVLGVLVIFLTATTKWTTSIVNSVSVPAHIALDYVLVVVLIASPFLFGFSDESAPTAIFIAAGVLHLLVSIGTRYEKPAAPPERPSRRGLGDGEIPEFEPPPQRPANP